VGARRPESDHDLDLFVKPEDAERALEVLADAGMRTEKPAENWLYVASLEDVIAAKLFALGEHEADYGPILEMARSVREQIDWSEVRDRTAGSPFAKAFFTLVEELGIVPARTAS
jgi:hypothetical protein